MRVLAKRKPLSKKTRFEVFKRDSFKCQYCGKSAPDVILHVDHIKPVAEGGTNDITNLITACDSCNLGKGARLLDDNSVIEKQRKQLEELNERRQQLEMMMEWRDGLIQLERETAEIVMQRWSDITGYRLNEHGEKDVRQWLKKYDITSILDAMDTAVEKYLEMDGDDYTQESIEKTFNYIGRICAVKESTKEKPYLKDLFYIRGILRNRLHYLDERKALSYLEQAYMLGASIESLKEFAAEVKNWTEFRSEIEGFIEFRTGGNE